MKRQRPSGPDLFGELAPPARPQLPSAAIVAGIDEAGLGPLLGPLTLGFSAFRAPTHELWSSLSQSCSAQPRERDGRLAVADSKQVFTRDPRGAARLEWSALSFLGLAGTQVAPHGAQELFTSLPSDLAAQDDPRAEPWFASMNFELPWCADRAELTDKRLNLARDLEHSGVELLEAGFRSLAPAELNRSFDRTHSKSKTQWEALQPILTRLWRKHALEGVLLVVDRQGGRMRYREALDSSFPQARTQVWSESPERSEYWVRELDGPRWMHVIFAERAESFSFPVALASCLAKYARETWMEGFNRYFSSLQPELTPTAGYVSDARRWLAAAEPLLQRSGLERRSLVRER